MDQLLPPELLCDAPWSDDELEVLTDPAAFVPAELRERDLAGDEQAAWALAEVAALHERLYAAAAQADAYTDRITAWLEEQQRPLMRRSAFLSERLQRYALAVRSRDGVKTLRLPSGEVSTTSHAAKVVIDGDEKLLAAWLHPRLTDAEWEAVANVSVTLRVGELRKLLTVEDDGDGNVIALHNGEPVPQVSVASEGVIAKVKPQPGIAVARTT